MCDAVAVKINCSEALRLLLLLALTFHQHIGALIQDIGAPRGGDLNYSSSLGGASGVAGNFPGVAMHSEHPRLVHQKVCVCVCV